VTRWFRPVFAIAWIALLRVPVTGPGQTVRVSRIGLPACVCDAARHAAMHALSELAVLRGSPQVMW
jgi:hypothetical protein